MSDIPFHNVAFAEYTGNASPQQSITFVMDAV